MTKERKKPAFISLHIKLLLVMAAALLCACAAYFLACAAGEKLIDSVYLSDRAVSARNHATIEEFRSYILENNLTSRDTDAIARWTIAKGDVYILLYRDEHLALEAGWWGIDDEMSGEPTVDSKSMSLYPVPFRDCLLQAVVYDYSASDLYDLVEIAAIVLACAVFALVMLLYNRRITRAIVSIARDVRQIGAGDLELTLTPRGNDELAVLTQSVEQMRQSILRKTAEEQAALQKNSDLITAMSHDIRNPLTALLGYLDLTKDGAYRTEEELQSYIAASYDKAQQLRRLTDELFRYSLLFGARELPMNPERYDAAILLSQLLGESQILLQQQGFNVELSLPEISCGIVVDVVYLKRVLDNLFDNVRKYADPSRPVSIAVLQENGEVKICISNTVRKASQRVESNRIGLRTVEKILTQMNGRFSKCTVEDKFSVVAVLPLAEC